MRLYSYIRNERGTSKGQGGHKRLSLDLLVKTASGGNALIGQIDLISRPEQKDSYTLRLLVGSWNSLGSTIDPKKCREVVAEFNGGDCIGIETR